MDERLCECGCGTPLKKTQIAFSSRECKARFEYGKPKVTGKSIVNGYVRIEYGDNRGRREHIVVAEQRLGRPLLPGEHVHHKDLNRQNNKLSNLEVRDGTGHLREHGIANAAKRKRHVDGKFASDRESVAYKRKKK